MATHAETLLAAIQLQRTARFGEAEALYRSVLAEAPDHPQALYLYGLSQLASGQYGSAADFWSAPSACGRAMPAPCWVWHARG
jgi:cytochrome c-type biogenesis protein CcmH/NrfG